MVVALEYFAGVVDRDRDDRCAGALRDLQGTSVEGQHTRLAGEVFIAGAFREDAHGDAVLYIINRLVDGLHAFADVVAVQEETVQF